MPKPEKPPNYPTGRHNPVAFRPRFTISLLYLAFFFFVFSLLQALPELIRLLDMPPGPEQEQLAADITRTKTSPLLSLIASLATTGLGTFYGVLPGMRAP